MPRTSPRNVLLTLSSVVLSLYPLCSAADFRLHMYLGDFNRSGAGKTVAADSPATAFTNPAGLGLIEGRQFSAEAQYFLLSADYRDNGSTDAISVPLGGETDAEMEEDTLIPGFYYKMPLNDQWDFGMTVNVPFGLSTEWNSETWVGRYQSIRTGIETVNINPAVAYKLSDTVSAGFGLSFQRAEAQLVSGIDFGAVCLDLLDPATCSGIGLPTPQAADGKLDLQGDDWGFGYHLGLMYAFDDTRVGVSYRSKTDYTLEGNADFTAPPEAAAFAPAFTDTSGRLDLTLPEVLSVGVLHKVTPAWRIMADATWTRWSRIERYRIRFANPAQPDINIPRNWEDTWRIALGSDYRLNQKWLLQGGVAYAESAIPDDYFDPTVPITDAWWINLGARYAASPALDVSFGLAHIIFEERDINYTGLYGETLRGSVEPALNVLGLALNWKL